MQPTVDMPASFARRWMPSVRGSTLYASGDYLLAFDVTDPRRPDLT